MNEPDREEDLDEGLRRRIATLASNDAPLSEAARERVIRGALAATRQRALIRRAAWSAAMAAPLAAAWWLWPAPDAPIAPRCEGWAPASDSPLSATPHSLGARGVIALEANSAAHFGARTACRTELVLERGGIVVRADDLGGGELLVLGAGHEVRVTGTLFSVRGGDEAFEVEVLEGHVRVDDASVGPGEHLIVRNHGLQRTAITAERIALVREALSDERESIETEPTAMEPTTIEPTTIEPAIEPASEPAPIDDPDRLAMEAERAFRAGDLSAARSSFRRAGTRSEAALVRWARLEIEHGHPAEAEAALDLHRRRFPHASLGAEAQYLRIEVADARHDDEGARAAATTLLERYPESPQARAARRRLGR